MTVDDGSGARTAIALDRLHQRRLDALPDQRRGRRLGDHQGRQGRRRQRACSTVSSWAAQGRRRRRHRRRYDRPTRRPGRLGRGVRRRRLRHRRLERRDHRPRRPAGRGDATRSSRARATRWTQLAGDVRALESPNQSERRASGWYHATQTRVRLNFSGAVQRHPPPVRGRQHWLTPTRRENVTVDDGSGARTAIALDRLHQRRLDALPDQRRGRWHGDHQGRQGRRRQRPASMVSSWAAQGRRRHPHPRRHRRRPRPTPRRPPRRRRTPDADAPRRLPTPTPTPTPTPSTPTPTPDTHPP